MLTKIISVYAVAVIVLQSSDGKIRIHSIKNRIITDKNQDIKYILAWGIDPDLPLPFKNHRDLKMKPFNSCEYQNCYYTANRNLMISIKDYHAILFHGKSMKDRLDLPNERDERQHYVFVMDESVSNYPMRNCYFDNFFNLTITYRLDSDIPWPYMKIIDKNNNNSECGPRVNMRWRKKHGQLDLKLRSKLRKKKKLAAWFVSNCHAKSDRRAFVNKLMKEIRKISNLTVDIYGRCGTLICPVRNKKCDKLLQTDYLFYLAFENSMDVDYVTEKVLKALQNDVVPVVYGGANYGRFVPPGSYLDAKLLGPQTVASIMVYLYWNRTLYENLFRWQNTYEFRSTAMDYSCELCARLNTENKKRQTYPYLSDWWNGNNITRIKCKDYKPMTTQPNYLENEVKHLLSFVNSMRKSLFNLESKNLNKTTSAKNLNKIKAQVKKHMEKVQIATYGHHDLF